MNYSGLIFDSSIGRSSGTVWIDLPSSYRVVRACRSAPTIIPRRIFSGVANVLLFIGAAGIMLTMLPVAAMEIKYQVTRYKPSSRAQAEGGQVTSQSVIEEPTLGDLVGPINEAQAFSVHIPKIDAHSVVIPNVDAGNPAVYMEALKKGIAHAMGTGLPGVESTINRTIYLFAHSTTAPSLVTRYNAQFYLLHKLNAGDEIDLTFYAQNYQYRVVEKKVIDADDTSFLTRQTEKELLVLATCWPPGTTSKRLVVIAERV